MTGLRFCLPDVVGRGAGLGNELVPWARAFLASQLLGARCLSPAFGLNQRRYGRHFGTPSYDWIQHRLLKATLPVVEFKEADYLQHGGSDVVSALQSFATENNLFDRKAFVLSTSGMWGGMRHIEAARAFVASKLYLSRFAAANLLQIRQRLDPSKPTVGIHVRLGDFGAALEPHEYKGRFNVSLPLDWYRRVANSIYEQLDGHVQFLIVSDASPERLTELCLGLPCVFSGDIPDSDCSDMLALAGADLLVCSISSFSVGVAFLSDAPYIWYGPNLHQHEEGFSSIWGHEPGQQASTSPTRQSISTALQSNNFSSRACSVGTDGVVPSSAIDQIKWTSRRADFDLIRYGVIRSEKVIIETSEENNSLEICSNSAA
ncbi:hypothetical protein ACVBEH_13895 [Roseateles sp. GG27B]